MSKLPISVHVLTWNSERTLEQALRTVACCAEILVIDGGSTDKTLEIAEKYGARVIPQRFPGAQGNPMKDFAAARNVGLEHATQPWVLSLDSDEKIADNALREITEIVTAESSPAAYWVPRKYVLEDGGIVDFATTYPNERIYFFHRDAVERWEKPVHERIQLKPGAAVRRLREGTLAPLPPVGAFYSKLAQYVRIEAEQSRGKGWWHWLTRRVLHTLRGRLLATVRLSCIWIVPRKGKRLPIQYEIARYWYAWRLMIETCPINAHS